MLASSIAAIVFALIKTASALLYFADKNLEQSVRIELEQLQGDLRAEDCAHMLLLTAERADIKRLEGMEQLLDLRAGPRGARRRICRNQTAPLAVPG